MIPLVMCVDDDSVTIMLCKILLKKNGFCTEFITADNGKTALDFFEKQLQVPAQNQKLPNLILLDLNMPVIDGWGFLDAFSEVYGNAANAVKVIILSSSINPADTQKAKEYPMVLNFVSKPLEIDDLNALKTSSSFSNFFVA